MEFILKAILLLFFISLSFEEQGLALIQTTSNTTDNEEVKLVVQQIGKINMKKTPGAPFLDNIQGMDKTLFQLNNLNLNSQLFEEEKYNMFIGKDSWADSSLFSNENIENETVANNKVVENEMDFLINNTDFARVIFPSKSNILQGNCTESKFYCELDEKLNCMEKINLNENKIIRECTPGVSHMQSGSYSCTNEVHYNLPFSYSNCRNGTIFKNCNCDGYKYVAISAGNMIVDLREQTLFYLEKSGPDEIKDTKFNMFCQPNSKVFLSNKKSIKPARQDYYCKNTIGIENKEATGKKVLYKLTNGNVNITLGQNDSYENIFLIRDRKEKSKIFFQSGPINSTNAFYIMGPCLNISGILNGTGSKENTLLFSNLCAPFDIIYINGTSIKVHHRKVDLEHRNMNFIIGRKDLPEHITCNCQTLFVNGKGGKLENEDKIIIPNLPCELNMVVLVKPFTEVHHSTLNGTFIFNVEKAEKSQNKIKIISSSSNKIFISIENHLRDLRVIDAFSSSNENKDLYKIDFYFWNGQNINITIETSDQTVENDYFKYPLISLTDVNGILRLSIRNSSKSLEAIHYLLFKNETEYVLKLGVNSITNYFNLIRGSWFVKGGNLNDHFMLNSPNFTGIVIGNEGINSLHILDTFGDQNITINLKNDEATWEKENMFIFNIANVIGRENAVEEVHCNCKTRYIKLNGGKNELYNDVIFINNERCQNETSIVIEVEKHTTIVNSQLNGKFYYNIYNIEGIDFQTLNSPNNTHNFQYKISFSKIKSAIYNNSTKILTFNFISNSISHNISQANDSNNDFIHSVIRFTEIEHEVTCDFKVDKNGEIFTLIEFTKSFSSPIKGIDGMLNNFTIKSPNSTLDEISGGDTKNVFILSDLLSVKLLDGGYEYNNKLILKDSLFEGKDLTVDLKEEKGNIKTKEGTFVVSQLRKFNFFEGRKNSHDKVYVDCLTEKVLNAEEIIVTNYNCSKPYQIDFQIGENTNVRFEIPFGEKREFTGTFKYIFTTVRSLSIGKADWTIVGNAKHIFVLDFITTQLTQIYFSQDKSNLNYIINNENYTHAVNLNYSKESNSYSQPQFKTKDGFHILISREGDITFVQSVDYLEREVRENITQKLIPFLRGVANDLSVNIKVKSLEQFIFVSSNTSNENILKNSGSVSHLVGSGSNRVYLINNLENDVYIYPGFKDNNPIGDFRQIIDIQQFIKEFDKSYEPYIKAKGHNLVIELKGHEGKIIIENGTYQYKYLQFLFGDKPIEIILNESDSVDLWSLKPKDEIKHEMAEGKDVYKKLNMVKTLEGENDSIISITSTQSNQSDINNT